jgi:hypothetical protein
MKRQIARVLRAAARRLDPPAPMTIQIYGVPQTSASSQVSWSLRTGR